jgi:hypothetical protein
MASNMSKFDGAEVEKLIKDLGYLTPKQQLLLKAFVGFGIDRLEKPSDAPEAQNLPDDASQAASNWSVEVEYPDRVVGWDELFNRAFIPGETPEPHRTNGGKVGGSGVQFTLPQQP